MIPLPWTAAVESIGSNIANKATGELSDLVLGWLRVRASMSEGRQSPLTLPSVEQCLQLLTKGWGALAAPGEDAGKIANPLVYALQSQGVLIDKDAATAMSSTEIARHFKMWETVLQSLYSRPGVNEWLKGWMQGYLTEEEFNRGMRQQGALGADWAWTAKIMSNRLTPLDYIGSLNRGFISEEEIRKVFSEVGYLHSIDKELMLKNRYMIPSPSDLVRLSVREAFNPQQVKELNLDAELLPDNAEYLKWAKASGLGEVEIKQADGTIVKQDFAKLFWYAHWDLPSPTQAYQFVHRLYSDSRYGKSPWLRLSPKVERADLQNLLKAADYAPKWRAPLEAISYNTLTRVDVRRLRLSGIIKKKDVYHNYRAQGYDDQEAHWLTEWTEQQATGTLPEQVRAQLRKSVCRRWTNGTITKIEGEATLKKADFSDAQIKVIFAECESAHAAKTSERVLALAKRAFLRGQMNAKEAKDTLRQAGFVQARFDEVLKLWEFELFAGAKEASVSKLVNAFEEGLLTAEELVSRLVKLNYNQKSIGLIIRLALVRQQKTRLKLAKAAAAEAKKLQDAAKAEAERLFKEREKLRQEAERERQRLLKEAFAKEREALARFLSFRSEQNLRKWLSDGSIDVEDVRATLLLKGATPADAERWINNATKEK